MSTETAHKDQKERDISPERGYLVWVACVLCLRVILVWVAWFRARISSVKFSYGTFQWGKDCINLIRIQWITIMVDPVFRLFASQFFLNEILRLRTLLGCFQLILQSGGPKKYRSICLAFGTYYVNQRLSLRGTEVPIIYLFEQIHFFPL